MGGGVICEKSRVPGFSSKKKQKSRYPGFSSNNKKKNPGHRDLQGKFFRRYAPDQNIDLRPNGGSSNNVLGGGEFAVQQTPPQGFATFLLRKPQVASFEGGVFFFTEGFGHFL